MYHFRTLNIPEFLVKLINDPFSTTHGHLDYRLAALVPRLVRALSEQTKSGRGKKNKYEPGCNRESYT
jgi:hypothetical protein